MGDHFPVRPVPRDRSGRRPGPGADRPGLTKPFLRAI